jgi:hypothetical protein
MSFLWLAIDGDRGSENMRARIERNSIALLSNYNKPPLDRASPQWLGHHCDRDRVRASGMWNQNHVNEEYDPLFLNDLKSLVEVAER